LLSLFKVREWIINSIPLSLRQGIGAGIGLFLALIALQNAGVVVASKSTMVTMGTLTSPEVLMATGGFALIIALHHLKVRSGVLLSILAVTSLAVALGMEEYEGIVSAPPSLAPTFLELDIMGALQLSMLSVI